MMSKFKIDLDEDFFDSLFCEMEELSKGPHGHEFVIQACDESDAATETAKMLVPFFEKRLIKTT